MPTAKFAITLIALILAIPSFSLAIQATQPPDGPKPQPTSSYRPNPDEHGIYHKGEGVTGPTVIYSVEPEFSGQARKRKVIADVTVELVVDIDGHAHDVHAIKSEGRPHTTLEEREAIRSLEAKAVEAVSHYRFNPATFKGKPVPYRLTIEVNFQAF